MGPLLSAIAVREIFSRLRAVGICQRERKTFRLRGKVDQ